MLERLRFICITSSNLDEFFEVRMAGLQEQIRDNPGALTPDGMSLQHAYDLVVERAQRLVHRQYTMLHETVLPALEQEGIYFHASDTWNDEQLEWARHYFLDELLPVLTPIGLDPAHPFPRVLNKSLNFVVDFRRPRRVRTPGRDGHRAGAARARASCACRTRCRASSTASCCWLVHAALRR